MFPFLICLINSCLLKDRNHFSQNLRRPVSLSGHLHNLERTVLQKQAPFHFQKDQIAVSGDWELSPCLQNGYGPFWFKNQNELRGRNFIESSYFCDTPSFYNTKKYSILETFFFGVLLSRVNVQVEISPLFEKRFPHLEPCATPPSWLKIFSRSQMATCVRRKDNL